MASTIRLSGLGTIILVALAVPATAAEKSKPFAKAPDATQNMQACPEYGAGFFKMPGSNSCIRIGGRIRGETGIGSSKGRRSDRIDWRQEGSLSLDGRDNTSGGRVMVRVRGVRGSN